MVNRALHRFPITVTDQLAPLEIGVISIRIGRFDDCGLHGLARDQELLQKEIIDLAKKLVGADVFNLALSGAAREILIEDQDVDDSSLSSTGSSQGIKSDARSRPSSAQAQSSSPKITGFGPSCYAFSSDSLSSSVGPGRTDSSSSYTERKTKKWKY